MKHPSFVQRYGNVHCIVFKGYFHYTVYLNVLKSHYYKNIVLKIMRNMRLPSFISIIKGHVEQISCERTWVEHWPKLFENGTLQ